MEKTTYPGAIWIHRFGGREFGEREGGLNTGQGISSMPHPLAGTGCWLSESHHREGGNTQAHFISHDQEANSKAQVFQSQLPAGILCCGSMKASISSVQALLLFPSWLQHWWCRAVLNIPHLLILLGTAHIQNTELNYLAPMICNSHLLWWLTLKLKYFHVAAWISSAVGKDFLCWDMPANYISIWHQRWFAQIYSILGLFHLQFGGELIPLVFYKLGLCLLVQSMKM